MQLRGFGPNVWNFDELDNINALQVRVGDIIIFKDDRVVVSKITFGGEGIHIYTADPKVNLNPHITLSVDDGDENDRL